MKGMVLTERDRALLGYLGVARYATAAQVHRLIAPGHDKAIASRRLARLCERGPRPGEDPFLRRIEYRRADHLPFPVWTLTPHGRAFAERTAPGPVAVVQPGMGAHFVERVLALNEVLIGLVLALRMSETAPLSALPFRWRVADDPVRFEIFDRVLGRSRPALLRPDAILDIAPRRRRFFLEAETGTRGLVPAGPRDGHVTRRLERYGAFFVGHTGPLSGEMKRDRERTWYRAAFPDGFDAEIIVLVQSEARRAHLERVIRDHLGRSEHLRARALTVAAAASELKPLVAPPPPPPIPLTNVAAPATSHVRTVAIDARLRKRLDEGLSLFVTAYNAIRRETREHAAVCPTRFKPDPGPVDELNAFRELLLYEVLGYRREPEASPKP
jgi:hypothetical protein